MVEPLAGIGADMRGIDNSLQGVGVTKSGKPSVKKMASLKVRLTQYTTLKQQYKYEVIFQSDFHLRL